MATSIRDRGGLRRRGLLARRRCHRLTRGRRRALQGTSTTGTAAVHEAAAATRVRGHARTLPLDGSMDATRHRRRCRASRRRRGRRRGGGVCLRPSRLAMSSWAPACRRHHRPRSSRAAGAMLQQADRGGGNGGGAARARAQAWGAGAGASGTTGARGSPPRPPLADGRADSRWGAPQQRRRGRARPTAPPPPAHRRADHAARLPTHREGRRACPPVRRRASRLRSSPTVGARARRAPARAAARARATARVAPAADQPRRGRCGAGGRRARMRTQARGRRRARARRRGGERTCRGASAPPSSLDSRLARARARTHTPSGVQWDVARASAARACVRARRRPAAPRRQRVSSPAAHSAAWAARAVRAGRRPLGPALPGRAAPSPAQAAPGGARPERAATARAPWSTGQSAPARCHQCRVLLRHGNRVAGRPQQDVRG
jgi:hypothetical protein